MHVTSRYFCNLLYRVHLIFCMIRVVYTSKLGFPIAVWSAKEPKRLVSDRTNISPVSMETVRRGGGGHFARGRHTLLCMCVPRALSSVSVNVFSWCPCWNSAIPPFFSFIGVIIVSISSADWSSWIAPCNSQMVVKAQAQNPFFFFFFLRLKGQDQILNSSLV